MDLILLDWTRMGKSYCLAGVVDPAGACRIVRPLLARYRSAPVRNAGWSVYQMDGHVRWEVFELVGPEPAAAEPPHLEDLWVRSLRPRRALAPIEQRRAILAATRPPPGEALFGAPLKLTRTSAYLPPGTGQRSLTTVVVPSRAVSFSVCQRAGVPEPDVRVALPVPGVGDCVLRVKDHHLLAGAERATTDLGGQEQALTRMVRQMGEDVAVRLGLSRAFAGGATTTPQCWLMADGFFSLADPQP